jgi:gas vesicle protein
MAGFFLGIMIAGTLALLYAPKSGKQTRREIKVKAMLAKRKAGFALEDAQVNMESG